MRTDGRLVGHEVWNVWYGGCKSPWLASCEQNAARQLHPAEEEVPRVPMGGDTAGWNCVMKTKLCTDFSFKLTISRLRKRKELTLLLSNYLIRATLIYVKWFWTPPVWWPGVKNSPNVVHACRKRRLKWAPGAWGYSWATRAPEGI
jgi:hypothetical protein